MPWMPAVWWAVRAVPTADSDRGIDLFPGESPEGQHCSAYHPASESLRRFLSPLRKTGCERLALLRGLRAPDRCGVTGDPGIPRDATRRSLMEPLSAFKLLKQVPRTRSEPHPPKTHQTVRPRTPAETVAWPPAFIYLDTYMLCGV